MRHVLRLLGLGGVLLRVEVLLLDELQLLRRTPEFLLALPIPVLRGKLVEGPKSFIDVVQDLPPPPTSTPLMPERGEVVERKVALVGLVQLDAFANVQVV